MARRLKRVGHCLTHIHLAPLFLTNTSSYTKLISFKMDTLPEHVMKIIQDISVDNKLSSWRVFCEDKIVISLHYKPLNIVDQGDSGCVSSMYKDKQCAFRRKPPSAVERDRLRQETWKSSIMSSGNMNDGINNDGYVDLSHQNGVITSTPKQAGKINLPSPYPLCQVVTQTCLPSS